MSHRPWSCRLLAAIQPPSPHDGAASGSPALRRAGAAATRLLLLGLLAGGVGSPGAEPPPRPAPIPVAAPAAVPTSSPPPPPALPSASATPGLPQGPALHRALLGLWCNPAEPGEGRACWAHDRFLPDGRLRMCGRTADDPQPFRAEAEATVDGPRLCYRVLAATPNFWLPAGARYCTELVALDPQQHRYRDLDGGGVFTLQRLPETAPDCPAEAEPAPAAP